MPDSESIIVIWFKLLCLAGKINNGGVLLLNDRIAYTDEMLATIFRKNISTIRLALKTFEELEMILLVNNTITIPNWGKHQSLDKLEKKTVYQKEYMRKYRKEQRDLANGKSKDKVNKEAKALSDKKSNSKSNSKPNVRSLEGEIEEELDLELELDKEIYRNIVAYLNEKTGKSYKYTTRATRSLIDARVKEGFSLNDFKKVIDTKVASWKGDNKMNGYLRPNTLFGTKFESYLNEKTDNKNTEDYGW